MSTMDIFAQATRKGLRFQTAKGSLSVEDLWNLPVTSKSSAAVSLESIGADLMRKQKDSDTTGSFFGATSQSRTQAKAKKEVELKIGLVKFIGERLLKEEETRATAAATRANAQRIMELMEKKKDAALEGKSLEELQALLTAQSTAPDVDFDDE